MQSISVFAALAISALHHSAAFSTSTMYCRPDGILPGCPSTWPATICTADSGTILCKCPTDGLAPEACVVGTPSASSPVTGRCAEIIVKVLSSGSDVVDGQGLALPESASSAQEHYCKQMVRNDRWADYVRQSDDGPTDFGNSWSAWASCWEFLGKTWRRGTCLDSTRYIGESCWDGHWWAGNPGQCKSDDSYSEYAVSCYNDKCSMWAHVNQLQRPLCECGVSGGGFAYFWFACSSDTCDGHACVLSTGDGNRYCDYATAQTVTGWFR